VTRLALATGAWSPSLSPDGQWLAYVSDRNGAPRAWVHRRSDGHERPIETGPQQVKQVRWSVDGDWLAVLVAPGGSPRTEVWVVRPDGSDLHEIAPSPDGATVLGPWTHSRGVLATSTAMPLAAESVAQLERAHDGRRTILATGGLPVVLDLDRANRLALVRRGPRGKRTVWAIDLATGQEEQLLAAAGPGSTDLGRLSPDARVAYVRSDAGREMHALFAAHLATAGTPQQVALLAQHDDADLEHVEVTADGRTALLVWNCAGRSRCELLDLTTSERDELSLPQPVAHDGSFSRDGCSLAMTLEGPTEPRAVWVFDRPFGPWRRITSQAAGWPAPSTRPTLERLHADDGLEITGWLYNPERPAGEFAGAAAALLWLHGGPESQERPFYSPLFQELAQHGVAVFAANVRGSSGFGRSFLEADNLEKRSAAIGDVAACARHLLDRGVAAPGRLACGGRSYGGYLTLAALVSFPSLFAAGVDVCGIADFHTFYAHTEPWIAAAAYPKYGHPLHDSALLRALSPIHRFDALRAPLLVVHGSNDSNVPVEEAEQVVAAARARGVAVEYLLFAGEGHEIARTDHRELFVRTTVDWLVARLTGAATPCS
jgi:dipeptidyl aminopeptidase/acylaminoacyl peptidase